MKLTGKSAVITAAVMAASLLSGCTPESGPASSPAPQQQSTPASEEPPCEASDVAEGDFLEDCFGITPPKASPSPSKRCKNNETLIGGTCTKKKPKKKR